MKVNPSASLTASGTVGLKHAVYYGYTVTAVTATGPINIRKDTVTGQIIDVIPAATAAGASKDRRLGVAMDGAIFVEFNGGATGTVVIFYE